MKKRSKKQISYNMSQIRSKGSKIEKNLASALKRNKIRFRRHVSIIGKPDFVILNTKIAIFCDSAFWHGYRNMQTKIHKFTAREGFWINKIKGNIKRDIYVNKILLKNNWKVIRFWDFEIKQNIGNCIQKIKETIKQ